MDRHFNFVYTLGDNALLLYFLCFFRNDLRTSRKYRSDKEYKNITSECWRLFWKFWRITISAEALAENRLSERLIPVTRRKLQSFHLSNSIFIYFVQKYISKFVLPKMIIEEVYLCDVILSCAKRCDVMSLIVLHFKVYVILT